MAAAIDAYVLLMPRQVLTGRRWWQRLLDPSATHVAAVLADGPDRSLIVHPTGSRLQLEAAPWPARTMAAGLQAEWNAAALRWRGVPAEPAAVLRPPATCVEVVKAALGIVAWWVLTPRQLARWLLRRGAVPVPHPACRKGLTHGR